MSDDELIYLNKYNSIEDIDIDKFRVQDRFSKTPKDASTIIPILKDFLKLGCKSISFALHKNGSFTIITRCRLTEPLYIKYCDRMNEFKYSICLELYVDKDIIDLRVIDTLYNNLSIRSHYTDICAWDEIKQKFYNDIDFIFNHHNPRMLVEPANTTSQRYHLVYSTPWN